MRIQWGDISESAKSIALNVNTISLGCIECHGQDHERPKRSIEEPIDIGELTFDTETGREMIDFTEKIYYKTKRDLFHWKDQVYPMAATTVRKLKRMMIQFDGNIEQILKVSKGSFQIKKKSLTF